MVTINSILDAAEAKILGKYPGEKIYRNLVPKNFARPSFLLENTAFSARADSAGAVAMSCTIHIVAFEAVDDYHDTQLESLNIRQLALIGLFAPMFLKVGDRALHVTSLTGGVGGRDWSDATVIFGWDEDISDFESITTLPTMEELRLRYT